MDETARRANHSVFVALSCASPDDQLRVILTARKKSVSVRARSTSLGVKVISLGTRSRTTS
jgi:hypothetical protein